MAEYQAVDALDLPALYSQPGAPILLETLGQLAIRPTTFDNRDGGKEESPRMAGEGIPRYLTSIIGSPLSWIEDEATREWIWETASTRLSERSGRTAMPSVVRTFKIPLTETPDSTSVDSTPSINIVLREPSLTADNLGHKTWAASYLLARRLSHFRSSIIEPIREDDLLWKSPKDKQPKLRVVELGAGTGLVGLAAAAIWSAKVDLTDLPEICENLAHNCQENIDMIHAHGGEACVRALDWRELPAAKDLSRDDKYDMVVASDPLYSPRHPELVASAIARYLRPEAQAKAMVELPLREAYQPEICQFRRIMEAKGLCVEDQGEEVGYDDWEEGNLEVKCWWGVWRWNL